jgi:hypothetical protein
MTDPPSPSVEALARALVLSGGQFTQILVHMASWAAQAPPDAEPVDVVLERVLARILPEVEMRHGDAALAVAASVLSDATDRIADNLLIVPLGSADSQQRDHVRSRRRRRRR